jgi:two-component system, oxyanion-binding sensor
LRALYRASLWSGEAENHAEAARILARPHYLDQPAELMLRGLSGRIEATRGEPVAVEDFFVTQGQSATFPWVSHALWYYSQMARWGDVAHSEQNARIAAACYRPDLYRAAIAQFGAALPRQDSRPLDAGDFFDGRRFDPTKIDEYIQAPGQS